MILKVFNVFLCEELTLRSKMFNCCKYYSFFFFFFFFTTHSLQQQPKKTYLNTLKTEDIEDSDQRQNLIHILVLDSAGNPAV